MSFLYILKSKKDGNLYIGSTSNFKQRIEKHNAGLVRSTKYRKPSALVYIEGYTSEKDAREREHNLKLRRKSHQMLMRRIKRSIETRLVRG